MLNLRPPRHTPTLRIPAGWSRRTADIADRGLRCLSWRIPNPRCIAGSPPFIATIIHPPFAMDDVNTLKQRGLPRVLTEYLVG